MKSFAELGQSNIGCVDRGNSGKQKHEPIYFYHLSHKPLHENDSGNIKMDPNYIMSGESSVDHVTRICVAPSIEQCLIAIAPPSLVKLYIYRTVKKLSVSWFPFDVSDFAFTQERWLLQSRSFVCVGEIGIEGNSYINLSDSRDRFGFDFNNRGSLFNEEFKRQHKEYHRLKSYTKKYGINKWFYNENDWKKHQSQPKTELNTYARSKELLT